MLLFYPKRRALDIFALGFAACVAGCIEPKLEVDPSLGQGGSSSTALGGTSTGTGGTFATGGTSTFLSDWGGTSNTGGRTSAPNTTAGGSATGGVTPSGGAMTVGGTPNTGGQSATGGGTHTGGQSQVGGAASGGVTGSGEVHPTGGNATTGGSSAAPPPCLGNPLPMPAIGWVDASSNGCGALGPWYWFKDAPASGSTLETKVTSPALNVTPVAATGGKACLSGHTVVDSSFAAWGAGIGLDLNNPTGTQQQPYDYASHGIGGFEVTLSGSFPQGIKVQLTQAAVALNEGVPYVSAARPGTYRVRFSDAFVPLGWSVTNAGAGVDPARFAALQFAVNGSSLDSDFSFCVESVIPLPIDDDGSLGTKPVKFVNLPLDSTAMVTASSNSLGIHGLFTCAAPSGYSVTCGSSAISSNPYRTSIGGMCLSGMTTTATTNWGALINLTLNQASATSSALSYNGTPYKLRGFRVDTTNTTTGFPVQIKVSGTLNLTDTVVAPFEEFSQLGQHLTDLGSAVCPNWSGTTCSLADPASLFLLQVQLNSLNVQKSFDLCVMKLEAMVER
jgi:hypothetical protein